jgi:hypothetical protein
MYKIIGADQKEYGPVTADQVRQWLAEGRANAQTLVLPEGEAEWRPISAVPEFAATPGPAAMPPTTGSPAPFQPSHGTRDAALQAVKGPAIALLVTAILGIVVAGIGLLLSLTGLTGGRDLSEIPDPEIRKIFEYVQRLMGPLKIVQAVLGMFMGVVILMGALKMMKLQSYRFAVTAAVLAMIPCISPCCLLGLPFGIWALVVLNQPQVKPNFT